MDQPFTGERYISDGDKSHLKLNGSAQLLSTRKTAELSSAIMMTTSPAIFTDEEAGAYKAIEKACKLTRYGTDCYAYCLVALGQVDLVVESGLKAYDIAALIPIIENAGGVVTNWKGQSAASGGRILAAANSKLHEQALEILSVTD